MFKDTKKYQQVRPFILEKLRNLFYKNKNNLTEEQRQYLLSGINPEILKAYNIIYSSNTLYFKADKKGTDISKGLEYKVSSSDSRKASFAERMKAIELNRPGHTRPSSILLSCSNSTLFSTSHLWIIRSQLRC